MAGINLDVSGVKVLLEPVSAQTFSLTVPSAVPAVVEVLATGPQGPAGADGDGTAYYGQVASQTSQTFTGLSQNVYVPVALTTFTLGEVFGFEADGFGLRNVSGSTQLVWAIATVDSSTGNNRTTGLRLAVDGVGIDLSVCTATTGTQNFAKLMSQFLIEVPNNETVTCQVANLSGAQNVTVQRAKLVLSTVGRQGIQGEQGPAGPGVPVGGVAGEVLVKQSATDYDADWENIPYKVAPTPFGTNRFIQYIAPSNTFTAQAEGTINWFPFYVPVVCTVDQILIRINNAGTSGSLMRLGLYTSASHRPSTLILEGTVNTASSGNKTLSFTAEPLAAGWYWFASVTQGEAGTRAIPIGLTYSSSSTYHTVVGNLDLQRFYELLITASHGQGALPSTAPAITGGGGVVPNFAVRFSA